jgi:hypothetical protein
LDSCGLVGHGEQATVETVQHLVLFETVDEHVEERRVRGLPFSSHLVQCSEEGGPLTPAEDSVSARRHELIEDARESAKD